jgi:hypothetical protein
MAEPRKRIRIKARKVVGQINTEVNEPNEETEKTIREINYNSKRVRKKVDKLKKTRVKKGQPEGLEEIANEDTDPLKGSKKVLSSKYGINLVDTKGDSEEDKELADRKNIGRAYHNLIRAGRLTEAESLKMDALGQYYFMKASDYDISKAFQVSLDLAKKWRDEYFADDLSRAQRDDARYFVSEILNDNDIISKKLIKLVGRHENKPTLDGDRLIITACRALTQSRLAKMSMLKSIGWTEEVQYEKYRKEDKSKVTLEIIQKLFMENLNPFKQNPKAFLASMEEAFPGITTDVEIAKEFGFDGDEVTYIQDMERVRNLPDPERGEGNNEESNPDERKSIRELTKSDRKIEYFDGEAPPSFIPYNDQDDLDMDKQINDISLEEAEEYFAYDEDDEEEDAITDPDV